MACTQPPPRRRRNTVRTSTAAAENMLEDKSGALKASTGVNKATAVGPSADQRFIPHDPAASNRAAPRRRAAVQFPAATT